MTLTTLDVSNNTALRKLTANNTGITSLDLSQNPAVYYLAFKTNGLTSIDVSNLPLLNYLYCDENELTSIDVSQNPLLYTLSAPSNNLTSLNVANGANSTYLGTLNVTENPDLTCIQIDEAFTPTEWEKDTTAEYNTNCGATANTVDENFNNTINVFPNPIINTLHINLATGQEFKKAQIFNMLGKKVLTTTNTSIDMSSFSSGIYLLKIENRKNNIAVRKIIKK